MTVTLREYRILCFMDIIFEIFIELYVELMLLIVPEKRLTKRLKIIINIVATVVTLLLLAIAIWGIYLIAYEDNLLGIIPTAAVAVISVVQILFGIKLYNRNH